MDPAKVKAVMECLIPTSRKHLQQFLSFANFYRRFICNYSQEAASLTHLTYTKLSFTWSPEANTALTKLKDMFSTTPVLVHPDVQKPFSNSYQPGSCNVKPDALSL